jgi:hypothetical protein
MATCQVTHHLTLTSTQWLAMPNNLIFMGLHFVIGKRMYFLYGQLFLLYLPIRSICQLFIGHVRLSSLSFGANFDMPKRLNTRQVLRHARSTSGGGSGEHRVPVKISGGGRIRSPDPDGFSVCLFFTITTSRKVTHMNAELVVKPLAWPCS